MKVVVLIVFMSPLLIWSQKFLDIPLNSNKTDIVYEALIKYDNPSFNTSDLLNIVSNFADTSSLSNIKLDRFNKIFANGIEVVNHVTTNQYQYQFNYLVSFRIVDSHIEIQISKIAHYNKIDVLKSMGYCFDFRNKDSRFKYFDVLSDMNLKMGKRLNGFEKEIMSMINKNEKIVSKENIITYVDEVNKKDDNNHLSQNDYVLKSAESLNLFYKQKRNSFYFSAIGGATIYVSSAIENNRQKSTLTTNVLYFIGGGLTFTGFVLNIDSYKHIRNSSMYLKKSAEGITIGLKF